MRNTQNQRCMNHSPLAARVHWIIVVSRLMPNHRPLLDGGLDKGLRVEYYYRMEPKLEAIASIKEKQRIVYTGGEEVIT
ncbi:hypothetical protein NC653_008132 [Populus alba x Populus x berolinensis]|uniref:Uncharacterized protein n=1 Tax=Populus alba x Populus x berolinensis TaxID=444605 RepID=A0AAD6R5Y8_9ROSI|nr:hypothetical protein NC653_008132 [Populus alba x Populus x berolinensis]